MNDDNLFTRACLAVGILTLCWIAYVGWIEPAIKSSNPLNPFRQEFKGPLDRVADTIRTAGGSK